MIYKVKAGETVLSLSKDFRVSPEKLADANRISIQTPLTPGMNIVIPGLPEPDSIPYRIAVSINKKSLAFTGTVCL